MELTVPTSLEDDPSSSWRSCLGDASTVTFELIWSLEVDPRTDG
ncbi:hypothetical protein D2E26_1154 [Bifidobacterium dolichotidis]|uniref:Uncharacterized protein n=1 Tax=Bifidobacterium dolichotidis TaxID=2306976 RepID=A0A430FQJ8_9BIFI|nr:hypothetical protein D2E26_1154 [Bifidobacterium dolichotidis]